MEPGTSGETFMARQPAMSLAELLALDVTVDIVTAGRAFRFGKEKTYELAQADEFPCRVLKLGKRYCVTKADLLEAVGLTAEFMAQVAVIMASHAAQGEAA
jgi:hypothetical protein